MCYLSALFLFFFPTSFLVPCPQRLPIYRIFSIFAFFWAVAIFAFSPFLFFSFSPLLLFSFFLFSFICFLCRLVSLPFPSLSFRLYASCCFAFFLFFLLGLFPHSPFYVFFLFALILTFWYLPPFFSTSPTASAPQ